MISRKKRYGPRYHERPGGVIIIRSESPVGKFPGEHGRVADATARRWLRVNEDLAHQGRLP
jgi:hypothetical protein